MSEKPVPEWVWTSSIVLGWCDAAGCASVGHKANNCRLARSLAAEVEDRRASPASPAIVEAKAEVLRDADTAICNAFLSDHSQMRRQGASKARKIIKEMIAALRQQDAAGKPCDHAWVIRYGNVEQCSLCQEWRFQDAAKEDRRG